MRAGNLRTRLTLQRATITGNEFGEQARTWSAAATVWAQLTATPSRITVQAEAGRMDVPLQLEMRYRDDVTAQNHRFVDASGTVYEIASPPIDPDGRRERLQMLVLVRQHAGTAEVVP